MRAHNRLKPPLPPLIRVATLALLACLLWPDTGFALDVGDIAKDFALWDSSGTLHTLGRLRQDNGRVVLLELLSVYCDACRKEVPHVNELAATYRSQGLRVIGVALANTREEVASTISTWGTTYPVLADPDKTMFHLYGGHRVPVFFVIGPDGIIRHRCSGIDRRMKKIISELLADPGPSARPGDKAPAFPVAARDDTHQPGNNQFRETTVLVFITEDDERNRDWVSTLQKSVAGAGPELRIVAVFARSFSGSPDEFAARTGMKFPGKVDDTGTICDMYRVSGDPDVVVVNEQGRIARRAAVDGIEAVLAYLHESTAPPAPPIDRTAQSLKQLNECFPEVRSFLPVPAGAETIFIGLDGNGTKYLARIVKKEIICSLCRDVHFSVLLDQEGIFRDICFITPLELYGRTIDPTDFLAQFIGASYHKPFVAASNVDVITGATQSSHKVIDGLNETEPVLRQYFKDPEFDATFRRTICYLQQSDLEVALSRFHDEHPDTKVSDIAIEDIEPYCQTGSLPSCPSGGQYMITTFNNIPRVSCTIHGLDPQSAIIH